MVNKDSGFKIGSVTVSSNTPCLMPIDKNTPVGKRIHVLNIGGVLVDAILSSGDLDGSNFTLGGKSVMRFTHWSPLPKLPKVQGV